MGRPNRGEITELVILPDVFAVNLELIAGIGGCCVLSSSKPQSLLLTWPRERSALDDFLSQVAALGEAHRVIDTDFEAVDYPR